jgi:hypothetical protein
MSNAVKQTMCLIMGVAVAASGCATAGSTRVASSYIGQQGTASRSVLVDYVQKLPPGTLVRVNRAQGHSVRGTLMKATDQSIFVQPKTRLPEGIIEIPVDDLLAVTPEPTNSNGVGRAIGAGAAAGAAAAVAIIFIIIAVAGD